MKPSHLTFGLAGLLFTASAALHACSSSTGGSTYSLGGDDGGASGGGSNGGLSSSGINLGSSNGAGGSSNGASTGGGSSGTGSSGTGSGSGGTSTSTSSSGTPFVCPGCIDLSGHCQDGGEDLACGLTSPGATGSPTCSDCTQMPSTPVCRGGVCVSGSAGSSSGGSSSGGSSGVDAGHD